jgi:hypothetical protein
MVPETSPEEQHEKSQTGWVAEQAESLPEAMVVAQRAQTTRESQGSCTNSR